MVSISIIMKRILGMIDMYIVIHKFVFVNTFIKHIILKLFGIIYLVKSLDSIMEMNNMKQRKMLDLEAVNAFSFTLKVNKKK